MDRITEEAERKLALTYASRRITVAAARDARIASIHAAHIELAELAREIAIAGSELVLEALDPTRPPQAHRRLQELESRRIEALKRAGLPDNYDQPRPICARCQDTGCLAGGGPCSCRDGLLRQSLRDASGLGPLVNCTFDAFDETIYDDQVNESRDRADVSPLVQMNGVHIACRRFVQDLKKQTPDLHDLLFTGMPGTGKTYMAACVANEAIDAGLSVMYLPAPRMFDILGAYRALCASFRPDEDRFEEAERDYSAILDSRLLIVDDLGTEPLKSATLPELLQILDHRHGAGLRTLFCTNAALSSLRELYDERLRSRLIGRCTILRFFGDDLRMRAVRTRKRAKPRTANDLEN